MIKINLYPGKGTGSSVGAGLDFNQISIKGMILAVSLYLLVNFMAPSFYDSRGKKYDTEIDKNRKESVDLKRRLRVLRKIEAEIQSAEEEEKFLQSQHKVLLEIVSEKRNPMQVLLYISKNIPSNTWITTYKEQDKNLTLEGKSFNYSLIGQFFESMENAIFFAQRPRLQTQSLKGGTEEGFTDRRIEEFSISGRVKAIE